MVFALGLWIPSGVPAGEIAGYVVDDTTGQPISGLDMNLYDAGWNYVNNNALTLAGNYRFYNVPAGTYYVRANPMYPYHYQHEYWNDAPDRASATPVTVTDTGEVTGIDFSLIEGWYIEGKVADVNGVTLGGIDINVYDLNWTKLDVDTETDAYGRYYIGGLPGGDYYVMANPIYMQPYVDQYFDGSAGPIHATPVTLVPPEDLTAITFTLDSGSYICGRVTDRDTGEPLPGIRVKAYNGNGSKMRIEDRTDADGYYILGAYRDGNYTVRIDPSYPDGYMDMFFPDAFRSEDAQPVMITAPKPTVDINIAAAAGSYVRGTLDSDSGDPLVDIKMKFYDRDAQYMELATTYTKADGTYLSGALKPGKYYVKAVPIYPQPWIDEYYPDAVEIENAETIDVALAGETTGIDLSLQPGAYLSGTITHAVGGYPLEDVDLDVYDGQWNWVDYSDHTSSHGDFLIGALPFGTYFLRADPSVNQGFVPQYYHLAFYRTAAVSIEISEGTNAEDLNFSLADGGFVSGRVVDAVSGHGLESIEIHLLNEDLEFLPLHSVITDAQGEYIAHGIPTGNYYALASNDDGDGYQAEYYPEAATAPGATKIAVLAGETIENIDFTLDPDPLPTATPSVTLGVELEMPGDMFHSGDLFYLNARVGNPGQAMTGIPLFVILDVYGDLFFWPGWIAGDNGWDYQTIDLDPGIRIIPVIPAFDWPVIDGSASDLRVYAGMTRPDFSRLLGDMDIITFGYE